MLKKILATNTITFLIGSLIIHSIFCIFDTGYTIKEAIVGSIWSATLLFMILSAILIVYKLFTLKFKKKRLNYCRMCEIIPNVSKKHMKEAIGKDGLCVKCHLFLCQNTHDCKRCEIINMMIINTLLKSKIDDYNRLSE